MGRYALGTGKHVAPECTQPEPSDYGWRGTEIQVAAYVTGGPLVSPGVARTIASGYQSAGRDGIHYATFASTGTLTVPQWRADELLETTRAERERPEILDAVERDIADPGVADQPGNLEELTALRDYVLTVCREQGFAVAD